MSNNIRELRNREGWSQEQLGQKLGGLHYNTIMNWENEKSEPRAGEIAAMAELFGCTVAQVMGLEPVPDASAA